jgi:DNA-binding IclR family transcriptional regulator
MSEDITQGGSISRLLRVIYLMADQPGGEVGITQASRALDMPKAAVHRILRGLVDGGFVRYDDATRRYALGPGALTVGLAVLRGLNVPEMARPVLQEMVDQTGETATLSVFRGTDRIYIDQVVSPKQIRFTVELGASNPIFAGSSSKSILAALPPDQCESILDQASPLVSPTGTGVVDRDRLLSELEEIRRRGYAVSFGERDSDAASVAAAILQPGGQVFGALSLCGPISRFDRRLVPEYGALVVAAADKVSAGIGYDSRPVR